MAAGLTRRIGIVALGRAAHMASLLAVSVVLADFLLQEQVGIYKAVWLLVNSLVPLASLGVPAALLYYFPQMSPERRPALVFQALGAVLAAALALVAALYFFGDPLARLIGIENAGAELVFLQPYLRPFLPYVFFLVVGGAVEAVLVAAGRPHWQAGAQLVFAVLMTGLALWARSEGWDLSDLLGAFGLMGLARLIVALVLVWRCGVWSHISAAAEAGLWEGARSRWSYARTIWYNDGIGSASRLVDSLVILHLFTIEVYAEYSLGNIEVPVNLLLAATVTVLVPEISRLYQNGDLSGIATLWRESVARLSLVIWPLFFFLFTHADSIMAMYPDNYGRTAWVFRVFLLALPLRIAVYNPLLVGIGKAKWALWGSVGDLLLNIGLSLTAYYILIRIWPEWAFLGPAGATVFATYIQVFFLVAAIAVHLRWQVGQLLPWASLGRGLGLGLLASGFSLVFAAWAGHWWGGHAWGSLLVGSGIFAMVYGVGWSLGGEERRRLLGLLRGLGRR
jgi:O-antigen/teichoic acid export membrane protein